MKRYIVTCAVPGAELNEEFRESIKTYCKVNKAELIVIIAQKLYKDDRLDDKLAADEDVIITTGHKLNKNFGISSIPINPESADPVAGLERFAGSWIFASPKQRMKSVPKSNHHPRVLMTPGAITRKYYRNSKRGLIAGRDHIDGAIIVEIASPTEYHFRQVQADAQGRFIDLAKQYSGKGVRDVKVSSLTPGDWHAGSTDETVRTIVYGMLKQFKPDFLVLHDFFDGLSVNHHMETQLIQKSLLKERGILTNELAVAANDLSELDSRAKQIIIVRSNHDDFLDKWLDSGAFIRERENLVEGLELALAKAEGHNPFEYAMRKRIKLRSTRFLRIDEEFIISGVESGVHGHKGPNGARGSNANLEKVHGKATVGHTHTPEILRQLYCVGTSTFLRLLYNEGASSWLQTLCLTYENGSRQLINIIDGKWRG